MKHYTTLSETEEYCLKGYYGQSLKLTLNKKEVPKKQFSSKLVDRYLDPSLKTHFFNVENIWTILKESNDYEVLPDSGVIILNAIIRLGTGK